MAFYARLLAKEPMLIIGGTGNGMLGPCWPLKDHVPDECFFLINFWTHFSDHTASNLRYEVAEYRRQYPRRNILFLANEYSQLKALRKYDVPAIMGNHNLFIDESIFKPVESTSFNIEAIYNARMNEEKRHELCSDLPSVGFIYYFNPHNDFDWFNKCRARLVKAKFLNGDPQDGSYRHFTPAQCAELYRSSRVGLCLSQREGAMLSSMEYLMCGIPVVTTNNMGGRNHFFRPEFSILAEDNPKSIAEAVAWLIKRDIRPLDIYEAVMDIVSYERHLLFRDITDWLSKHGQQLEFAEVFKKRFVNRMWETFDDPNTFLASL
jgi:glycosyltransferase involved in cell wall biosynthesis